MSGEDLTIGQVRRKRPDYSNYNLAVQKSRTGQVHANFPMPQIGNLLGSGNITNPQTRSVSSSL